MYKQNKWLLNFRVDCGHMVFLIKIAVLNGKQHPKLKIQKIYFPFLFKIGVIWCPLDKYIPENLLFPH